MERENHDKILKLEGKMDSIQKDTSEIKESINTFIAKSNSQEIQLENLRGRVRAVEKELTECKYQDKLQDAKINKMAIFICGIASAVGVGGNKLLSLIFGG